LVPSLSKHTGTHDYIPDVDPSDFFTGQISARKAIRMDLYQPAYFLKPANIIVFILLLLLFQQARHYLNKVTWTGSIIQLYRYQVLPAILAGTG